MFYAIKPQVATNEFGEVVSVQDRYTISLNSDGRTWFADVEFGVGMVGLDSSSLREVFPGGVSIPVGSSDAPRILSLLKEGMDCLGSECLIE